MEKAEKIKVCIPGNGDDDARLEVGLNGEMYLIKRDEDVLVESAVYEILVNAGLVSPKGGGEE